MVCCQGNTPLEFYLPPDDKWVQTPWGKMQTHFVAADKSVWFKTLVIDCGHQLSLQRHEHRSEIWLIRSPEAYFRVTVAEEKSIMHGEQRIEIPRGYIHTIQNMSSIPLVIYETAFGRVDENDIIRLYDPYANQR